MRLVTLRYDGHTIYARSTDAVRLMLNGWDLCR